MAEWEAFFALEPWGGQQDDQRAGMVCATVVNSAIGRQGKPRKPSDFFPALAPPKVKPGAAELREKADAFFGSFG
ncbi:MAG TPA: hypothetical protein VD866_03115 [Urbifossiella sp.]|nr:hypothetical protein [Urbifossiella sp.]